MRARIHFRKGFFPLLFSSLIIVLCLAGCAEDSSILDNSQNRQLGFSVSTHNWSNSANSNKSSDQKVPSRATPISGNIFDTSNSFNVIADVNKGGNWTTEIKNELASYSTANNIWQTTATHYWPGTGSTVYFYAYYPTSISSSITHNAGCAPVLSYTVPDNAADQIDILASSKAGVAGDSYNQTPVDFKHIFAAVQFQVGSSGLPSGTISSISIGNVANSGTYTFGSGWSNVTGSKIFTVSPSTAINGTSGEGITSGTYTFLMIPQIFSNVTITLSYSNGTTFSTVISGTCTEGNTYTYQLSKSVVYNFDYTGNVQSFTASYTGIYKLEVWGAEGGYEFNVTAGGKGGYSVGYIQLSKGQNVYVCVGGSGNAVDGYGLWSNGGYNGGGKGMWCSSGGGATHIATTSMGTGTLNNYVNNRDKILIVAGGGGGSEWALGGDGGGVSGSPGSISGIPTNVLQDNTLTCVLCGLLRRWRHRSGHRRYTGFVSRL